MNAAPALAAALRDVVACLGIGLLLAAARDALGLLLGNGRVRCFAWDLAAFAGAAVLLCGRWAGSGRYPACCTGWLAGCGGRPSGRCGGCAGPWRCGCRALAMRLPGPGGKKTGKKSKNVTKQKKLLQTDREILYN